MAKPKPIRPRTAGRKMIAVDDDTWKLANTIAMVNRMKRNAKPSRKHEQEPATQGDVVAKAMQNYADDLRTDKAWRVILKTMLEGKP